MTYRTLYVTEPCRVSGDDTSITGQTIRAYEITDEPQQTTRINWRGEPVVTTIPFTPTGRVFYLKDNKIEIKKTKARLQNKTIYQNSIENPVSSVTNENYSWHCAVFTSPQLALYSKHKKLLDLRRFATDSVEKQVRRLRDSLIYLDELPVAALDSSFLTKENPELFI